MIRYQKPSKPRSLSGQKVTDALESLREKVLADEELKVSDFKSEIWRRESVRGSIMEAQYNKCCYCEQRRPKSGGDMEHFRPKRKPTEASNNHKGYWWLAYDWDNLMYACKECNQAKKRSHFPLQNEDDRAYVEADELSREQPILVNPFIEDPEDHFRYEIPRSGGRPNTSVTDKSRLVFIDTSVVSDRDRRAWKVCGLNRDELLEARAELLDSIREAIQILNCFERSPHVQKFEEMGMEKVSRLVHPSAQFSGMARFMLRNSGFESYVDDCLSECV